METFVFSMHLSILWKHCFTSFHPHFSHYFPICPLSRSSESIHEWVLYIVCSRIPNKWIFLAIKYETLLINKIHIYYCVFLQTHKHTHRDLYKRTRRDTSGLAVDTLPHPPSHHIDDFSKNLKGWKNPLNLPLRRFALFQPQLKSWKTMNHHILLFIFVFMEILQMKIHWKFVCTKNI